jgi:hypothetical protein
MDKIDSIYKQAFNFENPIVFFPVRHHSVACSYHLQKTVESYKPQCILIEGPGNANNCISSLIHENSKPPISIYCSLKDTNGVLGDKDGTYHCYYPFLEYSPEYQALKLAHKQNIPVFFIDLPYGEYLIYANKERENYNHDYLLAHSKYISRLCEKQKCRNFNELWEKLFELDGLNMSSSKFVKTLLTYCIYARKDYTQEILDSDGSLAREFAMAEAVSEKQKKYEKTLVVTGGFHTEGILSFLNKEQSYTLNKESLEANVYVMAYSFKATDQLNGYASGMPYTAYYQNIWEEIQKTKPYNKTLLKYIVACGNKSRLQNLSVSIADEIEAYRMAIGLTALRDKTQAGAFELIDAVETSFIKTDKALTHSVVEEILFKILTGDKIGTLTNEAEVPPLVKDFYNHLYIFGLQKTTEKNELTLEIYKKKKHKKISEFFHKMMFLKTTFCEKLKGPDFVNRKDMSRIREIWKYQWLEETERILIEKSMHGGTLAEATTSIVSQTLQNSFEHAGDASRLIIESVLMGLNHNLEPILNNLSNIIGNDGVFSSVATCFINLHYIIEYEMIIESKQQKQLKSLLLFYYFCYPTCQLVRRNSTNICS